MILTEFNGTQYPYFEELVNFLKTNSSLPDKTIICGWRRLSIIH
jgi:hypothetical protein